MPSNIPCDSSTYYITAIQIRPLVSHSSTCTGCAIVALVTIMVSVMVNVLTVSVVLRLVDKLEIVPLSFLPTLDACFTAFPASSSRIFLLDFPRPVKILNVPPTHHHNPPATLSSTRRFKMNAMTRKKNPSARKMTILSYQSAFSRCLTRWAEDFKRFADRSYKLLVDRKVCVDSSVKVKRAGLDQSSSCQLSSVFEATYRAFV